MIEPSKDHIGAAKHLSVHRYIAGSVSISTYCIQAKRVQHATLLDVWQVGIQ